MDLRIKLKPRKYTIKAQNLNNAYYDFLYKLPAATCLTTGIKSNGSQYTVRCNDRNKTIYVWNVEVFKRGKHRKNKHYDFYVYSIPMDLLDIIKMDIQQKHRNFTIKML
jgi:hypothetical protein